MFEALLKSLFGSKHDREVKRVLPVIEDINQFAEEYRGLPDVGLSGKTAEFRARFEQSLEGIEGVEERRAAAREALDGLLPEAFAAVKETCRRLCGQTWPVVGLPERVDGR